MNENEVFTADSEKLADQNGPAVQGKAKKSRSGLVPLYILVSIALVFSLLGTSMGAFILFSAYGNNYSEEYGETKEDDVVIAEEYVIKSTVAISDAYISGSSDGLSSKDKETLDMASAVLDEIITEGMSDYEKEKAVYEWMTENLGNDDGMMTVVPTTAEDSDNPYGVLKYHNAVCVGYATTFRMFMQMLGIPCMVVHNTELYHSWDLVQLDGSWYHTDIYSDAGNGKSYAHFNMCDDMVTENWDRDFFPAADSLTYNVLYNTAEDITDINVIPSMLREAYNNHTSVVAVKLPMSESEDYLSPISYMLTQIENILSRDAYLYWDYSAVGEVNLLTVQIEIYSDEVVDDVVSGMSEEDLEKLNSSITEAFGDIGDVSDSIGYSDEYIGTGDDRTIIWETGIAS